MITNVDKKIVKNLNCILLEMQINLKKDFLLIFSIDNFKVKYLHKPFYSCRFIRIDKK
jgi:hypothetical protein